MILAMQQARFFRSLEISLGAEGLGFYWYAEFPGGDRVGREIGMPYQAS